MNQNLQYLALGILAGFITPYALALIKKPQSVPNNQQKQAQTNQKETNES